MDCKKHARKHDKAQFELIIITFHKFDVSYPSSNLKEAKKKAVIFPRVLYILSHIVVIK